MKAYQLKVTIKGSKPPIWRRIIVPDGITFFQLHLTLQAAFEWMNYHLFQFEFPTEGVRVVENLEESEALDDYELMDAGQETIDGLVAANQKFRYIYDFGDWWEHQIEVEKIWDDYGKRYPCVLKYKGDGIPEDCGGIYGYYNLLEDLRNTKGKEHKELMEWAIDQGLKEYNIDEVNEHMEMELEFPKSKSKTEKDKPSNVDESMKEFWEYMHMQEKKETLEDIFSYYSKDEIKMIAKRHEIKNISKYNKEQLIQYVAAELLKPERMKRFFLSAKDYVMEAFESAIQDSESLFIDITREFDYVFDGGYCGIDSNMRIIVPKEVVRVYQKISNKEYHENRKRICKILTYCHIANTLYAVSPLEVVADIYNHYEKEKVNKEYILAAYQEVLPENCEFIYREGMFIDRYMLKDNLYVRLLQGQKDVPFYIPNKKEVRYYFENGCLSTPDEYKELYQFLLDDMKVNYYEEAYEVCQVIHAIIRNGCQVQDLYDFLEEQDLHVSTERQVKRLADIFRKLWYNTKMIINRGNSPKEMDQLSKKKTNRVISNTTGNTGNPGNAKVVPFPIRDE